MRGEMADTKAHLADTTDEDCSVTATQYRTSLEISNHTSCIGLRPSPYPVYLSIILVFITSSINTMLVSESVIYNKVCYEKLENVTLCSNLTFSKDHPLLQEDAAKWSAYMMAVMIIPAICTNMMLSSYCDTVGFKLPLTLPLVGVVLYSVILALLAYPPFIHWPMYIILLAGFTYGSFGGSALVMMTSYGYIARITRPERRSFYMTLLEASSAAGCLIGLLGGGIIMTHFDVATVGFVSAGVAMVPLLSTTLLTSELPCLNEPVSGTASWLKKIGVKRMLDAIRCVFKRRDNYRRLCLNLCFFTNWMATFASNGFIVNSFLFLHEHSGMAIGSYTTYFSYIMGVVALGGPLIIQATKGLNLNTAVQGAIASAFVAVGFGIMSVRIIPYALWIGGAFVSFQSVVYASARSYAVQLVKTDEIGKIFAYDAMLLVILQITSTILFKWIYSVTVEIWAGFFVALCGFLCLLSCLSLLIVFRLGKSGNVEQDERRPLLR